MQKMNIQFIQNIGVNTMRTMINKTRNAILGLLIGGLAGATVMLLFAPQSGKRTRGQIQSKSIQLRDRTNGMIEKELAEIRFDAHKITADVQEKAAQLKHHGQEKLIEQMDHISNVLDAGIIAVETA
jgi:gas vesicle protein